MAAISSDSSFDTSQNVSISVLCDVLYLELISHLGMLARP